MAVLRFKSKNSLISWVLLYLIIGTIICVANGAGVGGAILFIVINLVVVFFGVLPGSAFQNRGTATAKEKSTGLERIRLEVRGGIIRETNKMHTDEYIPTTSYIDLYPMQCAFVMVDCFYVALKKTIIDDSNFNDLAVGVAEHEALQNKIIDNFWGVSLGIYLYKAIENTSYEVNKSELKKALSVGKLTKEEQKRIYERAIDTISVFENDRLKYPIKYLGKSTMSFFGAELKRDDIADPTYVMAAKFAFLTGYQNTSIREKDVESLKEYGLIKKGK